MVRQAALILISPPAVACSVTDLPPRQLVCGELFSFAHGKFAKRTRAVRERSGIKTRPPLSLPQPASSEELIFDQWLTLEKPVSSALAICRRAKRRLAVIYFYPAAMK